MSKYVEVMKKEIAIGCFSALTVIIILYATHFFQYFIVPLIPDVAVYGAVALALILSWRFNKSRNALIGFILLIWFISYIRTDSSLVSKEIIMIFASMNLLLIIIPKERGLFSVHGLKKISLIGTQVIVYAFIEWINPEQINQINSLEIMHSTTLNISTILLISGCLIFMGLGYNVFVNKDLATSGAVASIFANNILYIADQSLTNWHFLLSFILISVAVIVSLYSMSYTDELTSLPGRRAFNEYAASLGKKYALAMADIDHFKKVNDKHGHDAGDEVLKYVAAILASVGSGGRTFRFGGEEFVIVFNGKNKKDVFESLEMLREKIQSRPFAIRNKKSRKNYKKTGKKSKSANTKTLRITISFGVSDSTSGETVEKVFKKADKALYRAKKKGRNQVCA